MSVDKEVEEALKQGKMVIIRGACESKVKLEYPKDKVVVITRK
ncbi:MAG: hypothetical protein QXZ14_12100 [Candidatus Jordarchaeales archaeon]